MLEEAGGGKGLEYSFTEQAQLEKKCRRERNHLTDVDGDTAELEDAYGLYGRGTLDEAKWLLKWLGGFSGLKPLERTILELLVDGFSQEEVANSLAMSLTTFQRKLRRLRGKLSETTSPDFWHSLHRRTVYRRPSLHCSFGKEECRETGICPYHRTRTFRI
ncbi:MAG: hypothetical protein HYX78_10830 [Armatimonadetes bacterium]|nr:hypothetical protein [Armatimonadota bacterium]